MKRKICVIFLLVLLFSSCGLVKSEQPPEVNFSFCASVTLQDETVLLQGIWDSTQEEQSSLTLHAPETVEEITYTQSAEKITVSFKELSYSFLIENFPRHKMVRCLFEIFRAWRNRPFLSKPTKTENGWIFSESYDGESFQIQTDSSGQILSLTVGSQIKIVFETQKE